MGFRTGAYCKVWDSQAVSDKRTKLRISISQKNKQTQEYEDDFSGFVEVLGTANAAKAAKLKRGDRIKLGDVDVSSTYKAETKTTYYNFKIWSFEIMDGQVGGSTYAAPAKKAIDDGEPEDDYPF